ncbi:MAG: OmpA family protein [Bacteroidota bacterium]
MECSLTRILVATTLLWLISISSLHAQSAAYTKGIALFERGDFEAAIPPLQKCCERKGNFNACEPLAIAYLITGEAERSLQIFEVLKYTNQISKQGQLEYALALAANGKFFDALGQLQQVKSPRKDSLTEAWLARLALMEDSLRYTIKPLAIPTNGSEICPVPYVNGILFAYNKKNKKRYQLFSAERLNNYSYINPRPLDKFPRSKFDDGPQILCCDGSRIYFTRTFEKFRDPSARSDGGVAKVYFADREGKNWTIPLETNFNSWQFSNAHPAVSPDGKRMIFASNRPQGSGKTGTDLFEVELLEGGFGVPQSLGDAVNTGGNELFPYLLGKDTLYFASDGHGGMGKLDLFVSIRQNGVWSTPRNLGYPLNSIADDFGLAIDSRDDIAYFSSNRSAESWDDLYLIALETRIKVQLIDSVSNFPITGASVQVLSTRGADFEVQTNAEGFAEVPAKQGVSFYLTADAEDFFPRKAMIPAPKILPGFQPEHKIFLPPAFKAVLAGTAFSSASGQPIEGCKVELFYRTGAPYTTAMTDKDGNYRIKVKKVDDYFAVIEHPDFRPAIQRFDLRTNGDSTAARAVSRMDKSDYILIEGQVLDIENGEPLQNCFLRVVDNKTFAEKDSLVSNSFGVFWISIPWDSLNDYSIIASGPGYFTQRVDVVRAMEDSAKVTVRMSLAERKVNQIVKTVYFDYDRSALKYLSKKDLNEIYYFLVENPKAKIRILSHTDSRGRASYNQRLSEKRAQAVKQFIIERKGIAPERIATVGLGESQLTNECDDYHTCSEVQHSENRRAEVIVAEFVD